MRHSVAILTLTISCGAFAGEPVSPDWWQTTHPSAIHWSPRPTAFSPPTFRGRDLLSGIPVSKRVRLSPDVQLLKGGRSDGENSLVAGVRMKIAF